MAATLRIARADHRRNWPGRGVTDGNPAAERIHRPWDQATFIIVKYPPSRSSHIDLHYKDARFFIHHGDRTDATNLIRIVQETQPTESTISPPSLMCRLVSRRQNILPMQRHRHLAPSRSHANPGHGPTGAFLPSFDLTALRSNAGVPQRETTPVYPRSPYAAAKL
jgi:hypothetical protein